jgi:hypothetical protein
MNRCAGQGVTADATADITVIGISDALLMLGHAVQTCYTGETQGLMPARLRQLCRACQGQTVMCAACTARLCCVQAASSAVPCAVHVH